MDIKIDWKYNKETEINRLIFTAGNIARGFYQRIGAPLYDELREQIVPNIHFPIRKIDRSIWNELKSNSYELFGDNTVPNRLVNAFEIVYEDIPIPQTEQITFLKTEFEKYQGDFFKTIKQIFYTLHFQKIIIIPTLYGIGCSYYLDNQILYIYMRIDTEISILFSIILKAQIQKDLNLLRNNGLEYLKDGSWYNKEQIAEYLMLFSPLAKLFPNHKAFLDNYKNPELNLRDLNESKENYNKLGFPIGDCIIKENNRFFVYENEVGDLSQKEFMILSRLFQSKNEIITFEDVAKMMWGENYYDRFSLNAISKQIFRIRQKLKDAGLQKEVIFTKRGRGYVLVQ